MLFSVVIPTYNRRQLLAQAIQSVFAQNFTDYELIVVDDGSVDDTGEYLYSLNDRFRLLSQEHRGPGAARNLGAKQAQGDYLAFLDSDDLWFPWTLESFARLIAIYKQPGILSARVHEFQNEQELSSIHYESARGSFFGDYLAASKTGYYIGSGMAVVDRQEFLASGGYLESPINAEDHELALRMGVARGFVQVLAPVTLAWRRHDAGLTNNLRRTYDGSLYLINREKVGAFPGGADRAHERREIICRHVRPVAVECVRRGMTKEGWELYRRTFPWHCSLYRWKFLVGLPFKGLVSQGASSSKRVAEGLPENGCV